MLLLFVAIIHLSFYHTNFHKRFTYSFIHNSFKQELTMIMGINYRINEQSLNVCILLGICNQKALGGFTRNSLTCKHIHSYAHSTSHTYVTIKKGYPS